MNDIVWDARFATGVTKIDLQHQCFVCLINELSGLAARRRDATLLAGKLAELHTYAQYHFCSEEMVMLEIGFPGLSEHRILHGSLLAELDMKSRLCQRGDLPVADLVRFLFMWFVGHTVDDDRHIGRWVADGGRSALEAG